MPHCILKCKNDSRRIGKNGGITFHRFPLPGHKKIEQWISVVQNSRKEDTWLPTSRNTYVCSEHFREQDFYTTKTGRRYLIKSAVPYEHRKDAEAKRNTSASPNSLSNEDLSDAESLLDTPRQIKLKNNLRRVTLLKNKLIEQNKKLKRQCRYLKTENLKLKDMVKQIQEDSLPS